MEEIIVSALRQFGFPAAVILLMLFGFYRLLRWVMEQSAEREKFYRESIDKQISALNQHTEQAKEFHNEVKTAHEFQRREHEQLADILSGIIAKQNGGR